MAPKYKKICFVVSSILTARFFLEHHIKELSKEFDVYLVGNFSEEDILSIKHFHLKGIKSIKIERNINVFRDLKSVFSFVKYIKKMKFNAVHSLAPKAGLVTAIAGKISGTENRIHIFTGQVWHTRKGMFKFLLKQFDKLIVLLNTRILVDGNSQRDYLINEGIVTRDNSEVLGKGSISGVDFSKFYPNKIVKEALKKELKIPSSKVVFLSMGRINKDKGIFDLAYAFKELLDVNKNIFLFIVGYDEGNCMDEINKIIDNDNHFLYYGSTTEPEKLIQVGDVFCLPSYREGFGNSIIEASSCKLAIVCSDTYGLKDTIINNETGLRHKVGNITELTRKMGILASDKNLIKLYGENGYEYVQKNFSANFVSKEWLNFYKNILK